jgi:uncharacterized cysteine cluster protein YcgN (CxxCxxCC family)
MKQDVESLRVMNRNNEFWKKKSLNQMTRYEWELLCDGCGICCLHKLEDRKTGKVFYTSVACQFLDIEKCRCTVYNDPYLTPSDCMKITPKMVKGLRWLPKTCAYRKMAEQKELEWWHPLISGNADSVHQAGISVRDRAVPEQQVHPDDIKNFIIEKG